MLLLHSFQSGYFPCVCVSLFDSTMFHFYKCCTAFVIHWRCVVIFFFPHVLAFSFLSFFSPRCIPRDQIVCRHNQKHHLNAIQDKSCERAPAPALTSRIRLLLLVFQTIFTFQFLLWLHYYWPLDTVASFFTLSLWLTDSCWNKKKYLKNYFLLVLFVQFFCSNRNISLSLTGCMCVCAVELCVRHLIPAADCNVIANQKAQQKGTTNLFVRFTYRLFFLLSSLLFYFVVFLRFSISTKWHTMTTATVMAAPMKTHSQFFADISIRINFNSLRGEKLSQIQFISFSIQLSTLLHPFIRSHTVSVSELVTIRFLK